jgi:hypothetical protein
VQNSAGTEECCKKPVSGGRRWQRDVFLEAGGQLYNIAKYFCGSRILINRQVTVAIIADEVRNENSRLWQRSLHKHV